MLRIATIPLMLCFSLLMGGCSSTGEFSGFSYDPEGATITTDKTVQPQHKRTIGSVRDDIWISNEFTGARLNDFYKQNDSLFRAVIEPENHPVNNSPWYAFKLWSGEPQSARVQLSYKHGEHRYTPVISSDGNHWQPLETENYIVDDSAGTAILSLDLSSDTLWISAQELITFDAYQHWADSLADAPFVSRDTVGYSHLQRPIERLLISEVPEHQERGVLILTGRQHPPEVTGHMAAGAFIGELVSDSRLAARFRKHFEIRAYPFLNPDGVENGHWRHNGAGVDLNRDWSGFNQPETRAVRDDLLGIKEDPLRTIYYGIDFHSTDENIFYPINRDIVTFPDDFTYEWLEELQKRFPDHPFEVEPFDTSSPITKNWIYHTFGADALTYEVNDDADRDKLKAIARESARIVMKRLLDYRDHAPPPSMAE